MKIAICAKNDLGLNSEVDDRFGRAEFYVIFDTEKEETIVIENSAKNEAGGAGGIAVRLLAQQGIDVIIVPELGPNASKAINAFEITAYKIDESKTVQAVLNTFNAGKLTKLMIASVENHSGLRKV